ncbi:MAG: acyltransferase [Bacteroidota bacterium]
MRLRYNSLFYKVTAVARYFVARAYYGSRFRCTQLSMIGSNCGVHISKQGQIKCAGRIVVNDHVMLQTQASGVLQLGKRFVINRYSRIVAYERIEIGDHVTIGQMVSILDHDHHYDMQEGQLRLSGYDTAPIKIGNNVWIADKVTILRGVTIGNNVVIAANAVINRDVPDGLIVGGVPAKILKEL